MRNKLVLAMVIATVLGVACTAGGEDAASRSIGPYANSGSTYKGTTLVGSEDVNIFQAFLEEWQTGQVTDVHAGSRTRHRRSMPSSRMARRAR